MPFAMMSARGLEKTHWRRDIYAVYRCIWRIFKIIYIYIYIFVYIWYVCFIDSDLNILCFVAQMRQTFAVHVDPPAILC